MVGNEDPSQPASGSKLDGADANPHLNQRYLVATSEQALCAMLAGAWVEGGDLPIKWVVVRLGSWVVDSWVVDSWVAIVQVAKPR